MRFKISATGLGCGALLLATQAAMATTDYKYWDLDEHVNAVSGGYYGNSISITVDGVTATVTGWSDTDGSTSVQPEAIESGELIYYGDTLGLKNQDETWDVPDHSIDSYDPLTSPEDAWGLDFDMVLVEFDEAVNLSHVGLGWAREDYPDGGNYSDISVLAFVGEESSYTSIAGNTWEGILGGGGAEVGRADGTEWDVVTNKSNLAEYQYHAITNDILSKYWLIGIYNPTFGEHWTSLNDGFKLDGWKTSSTTHNPPPPTGTVPSPGSLALTLLGLFGIRASRARAEA